MSMLRPNRRKDRLTTIRIWKPEDGELKLQRERRSK